jgi:hypothetical protein
MRRVGSILIAAALAAGCGSDRASRAATPTSPSASISAVAADHLGQVIDTMQANSINRQSINWTNFRTAVFADAGAAQTIPDLYPAIRTAVRLLGDGHSSYRSADGSTTIFVGTRSCSAPAVVAPALPATIGYVRVTGFSGDAAQSTAFADGVQAAIAAADRDDLIGWIVDLRSNGGGNMWPMIAGVGPVLGEGPLGYFIDPTGLDTLWEYRNGGSILNGNVAQRVSTTYRLRRPQPKVAVLVDNRVASSGEATFVAFIQRPNTRSFGSPTCGLSTSNRGFPMANGALLNLTTAVMADRAKTRYGDSIPPDEVIGDPDEAVRRAMTWLQQ